MTQQGMAPCLAMLLTAAAPAAWAHHNTGALFDLDAEVTLEGVVTDYEWANPHVYVFVDVVGEDGAAANWEVEAGPVAFMRRLGWGPDSLQAGDEVVLIGNPSRRANRREAFLVSVTRADDALPSTRGEAYAALLEENTTATGRAESLAGTWATVLDDETLGLFEEDDRLPLTPLGMEAKEAFDEETMHPGLDCTPYTPPISMLTPDVKSIEVSDSVVRIRAEFDNTERIVYLGEPDSDAGSSRIHGLSMGHFEGSTLVIETTGFPPHRSGITMGVPSGSRKRMVERLEPSADGTSLSYSFELEDPDYLATPVSGSLSWVYRPDLEYEELPCDPANARRFVAD